MMMMLKGITDVFSADEMVCNALKEGYCLISFTIFKKYDYGMYCVRDK